MNTPHLKFVLIVVGILILATSQVLAVTVKDTGIFDSSGNKAYSRAYDVVVCKGNNVLDDIWKTLTCDVVCLSTDTDCMPEVKAILGSYKNIYVQPGVYPMQGQGHPNGLYIYHDNLRITAYGAIFNVTINGNGKSAFRLIDAHNVKIEGLTLISNRSCAPNCNYSCGCPGIFMTNVTNIHLENVAVKDFNGFQVFIDADNYTNNVQISGSYFQGVGTADVIGGGPSFPSAVESNINIHHNIINQTNLVGTYYNALDLVGLQESSFNNNMLYGAALFGSESKGTYNSQISNNILVSTNGVVDANINILNSTSSNNLISNNILLGGSIYIKGTKQTVIGNRLKQVSNITSGKIDFKGEYNIISNNVIEGGRYGIYVSANYSIITDNVIYNMTGVNPIGIVIEDYSNYNDISYNQVIVEPNTYNQYGIYLAENTTWNTISNNKIINKGTAPTTNLTGFINIRLDTTNNSFYNNEMVGNYTGPSKMLIGSTNNYISDYTYAIGITTLDCNNFNIFNEKTIKNSTDQCTCISGTWKCIKFI